MNAADTQHRVDLIGFEDVDLSGWSIQGYASQQPEQTFTYRAFTGGTLKEARVARIYGGLAGGFTDPGVDLYFGGASGVPSLNGAVFQLLDPNGVVRHELAVLPATAFNPVAGLAVLPNGDNTKAFLLPMSGTLDNGYWQLKLSFARKADADLPLLSVGGDSQNREEWIMRFQVV